MLGRRKNQTPGLNQHFTFQSRPGHHLVAHTLPPIQSKEVDGKEMVSHSSAFLSWFYTTLRQVENFYVNSSSQEIEDHGDIED